MAITAVQFYGIDSVVEAYTNKGTPAFAIWCAKQLQFRYDGADSEAGATLEEGEQLLRAYLEGMWQGTTATYTLKVYDELEPGQKIRPSTEYDTAFNFKIALPQSQSQVGGYNGNQQLLTELQKMRTDIEELKHGAGEDDEGDEVDEDEPETIQEAVIGLLKEPERLTAVVQPLRELVDLGRTLMGMQPLEPMQPMYPQHSLPGAGVVNGVRKVGQVPDAALVERLGAAINVLERYDENLVDHLEKLAKVATSDPAKFKGLLSMLDLL